MEINVGGAYQRAFTFVGNDEDHPPIGVLQDIGKIAVMQAGDGDMAPFHQDGPFLPLCTARCTGLGCRQHLIGPRPGRVD